MTLFKHKPFSLAILAAVILSGCTLSKMAKLAEEQEVTVTPSPLELHGDSVSFEVFTKIPVKLLKPNKLYTVKTFYKYGPETNLEMVEFADAEFPNQKVEQPTMTKEFSFYYEDGMDPGRLVVKGVASNLEKTKYKETPEMEIAKGIITTSRLYKGAYDVSYADHGYNNKEELVPTNVEFLFEKGRSVLRNSEVQSEDGDKLTAFIASKNATRTVTITGSHSPEGLESLNSKLSENRAEVIRDFYFKKMKQYDYKDMADSIKFETKVIFQDWKPFFRELDKNTTLTSAQKSEVKKTINNSSLPFEETEEKLQDLSYYDVLMNEVYPPLRFSRTEIISVKPKKSDAEINILANAIISDSATIDTLSIEEFLFAATQTPLLDEKQKMYEAATKYESDKVWMAHNNLGAVYIDMRKKAATDAEAKSLLAKAKTQFDLANKKKPTAVTMNNLALCNLLMGNKDEAYKFYNDAASKNPSESVQKSINAGKGTVEIRMGNYDKAISSLKSTNEDNVDAQFNLGLAQLLSKDYNASMSTFEEVLAKDNQDALAYYCAAIVAARMSNAEEMAANLKESISIDAEYRSKALKDLEFMNYWENEQFKSAIQ